MFTASIFILRQDDKAATPAAATTEYNRSPPPPELRQGKHCGGPPTRRPAQQHLYYAPDATGKLAGLAPPRLASILAGSRSEVPAIFSWQARVRHGRHGQSARTPQQ